jgi:glycosyltransferase involved in cell wall biosynthesis
MLPEKIPLSVAIITKDEEKQLPDCLKSISFADDIVLVDSGSTDRTVEIAKEFGCRVFLEDWKGYGPQIMSAVNKCRHEWVLMLDADEKMPYETARKVIGVLKKPKADAYSFPRRNYFHGSWIRHSDWWPDRVTRLVRKSEGRFHGRTHGKWVTGGTIENLSTPIEHFSFSDYSDMLRTLNNYSSALSKEMFRNGKSTVPLSAMLHAMGMFFKIYFFKLGFLDGMDGFVIALTKAGGSFFKYAKLIELQRKENSG